MTYSTIYEAARRGRGWPVCECTGCGCGELATQTDDNGVPVCAECAAYVVDDDGDVICSRSGNIEEVVEWGGGSGNSCHVSYRLIPPEMPAEDQDGEWALYWDTVGNESGVVARFATRELAEQAVAAKDWPGPTDHTAYLCGYEVRCWDDAEERWVRPGEEGQW
jgi:hypothetical protein